MKKTGFSLIEVIIVLLLISLSISLVAPSLSRFSRKVELKGAAKKVSTILRYCRSEAVNRGQPYQALFDSNSRGVRVQSMTLKEEKIYSFPEGIRMKVVESPSSQSPSDSARIDFYPNGGSNGGTVLVDSPDNKGYKIKVDFLTGMVRVEGAEGLGR